MVIKVEFEVKITQADVAEHHGCSLYQVRKAIEDFGLDAEELRDIAHDTYADEIRDTMLEEFGNYID